MKNFSGSITASNPEVTGSNTLITIKRSKYGIERILLDCGMYNEKKYNYLNNFLETDASLVNSILITHNHQDHIGKLPYLTKQGYLGNIYCSKICKETIPIALKNAYDINLQESKYTKKGMLYSLNDVNRVKSLLKGIEYNIPFKISKYTTVTFFMNAHMLGAVSILLQIQCPNFETQNYLFFSDYSTHNVLFKTTPIPKNILKLPLNIIIESTYGDIHKKDNHNNFLSLLNNELKKGNNILLPSIVQERLEIILYFLKVAQDINILSKHVKIFIHSKLGRKYFFDIYSKYINISDILPKNISFVPDYDFEMAISYKKQKIIIAGSGIADNGPIRHYLRTYLSNDKTSIIFSCYTPYYSTGSKLKNANYNEPISINKVSLPLKATVLSTTQFSQHIRGNEWKEVLQDFDNIQSISIMHGQKKSKLALKEYLESIYSNIPINYLDNTCSILIDNNGFSTFKPTIIRYPLKPINKKRNNKPFHKNKY